jgi:hypothetical protein
MGEQLENNSHNFDSQKIISLTGKLIGEGNNSSY